MALNAPTSLPPPSYEQIQNPQDPFRSIEEAWDIAFKNEAHTSKNPFRANLQFEYRPPHHTEASRLLRFFQPHKSQPEWQAFLNIRSRNIPRLMKNGFRWSSANIEPGQDPILNGPSTYYFSNKTIDSCYKHHRWYWLAEKATKPEWKGRLHVFSKTFATALHFDVDQLTRDRDLLVSADCFNYNQHRVYHFDTLGIHEPFNLIYPELRLAGLWPWPRAEEVEESREEEGENEQGGGETFQEERAVLKPNC